MWLRWFMLSVTVVVLIISAVVYHKSRKCGCYSGEHYADSASAFDYLNAYNSVYAPPRPQFYEDCVGYNQWVRDANYAGRKISNACNKKFPGDIRCPMDNPWVETPCGL